MVSALKRNASNIRTLVCADNNAILCQITPFCCAVETLVLGKITAEILPILRLCKETLVRLELSPTRQAAPHLEAYTRAATYTPNIMLQNHDIRNGVGLQSYNSAGSTGALSRQHINDILFAILDLSQLEHLVLDHLGLRSTEHLQLFFEFCQQLTSLELHNTAVLRDAPGTLDLSNLRSLSLVNSSMAMVDQVHLLRHCKHLDHLSWIQEPHMMPLQALGLMLKNPTTGRAELKSLDISSGPATDTNIAEALLGLPCLTTLIARESQFGQVSLDTIVEPAMEIVGTGLGGGGVSLRDQIQVLDLVDCPGVTPEMVNEILCSCRGLKRLSADRIRILSVLLPDSVWVCNNLEELRVVIVGPAMLLPPSSSSSSSSSRLTLQDLQRTAYQKIATSFTNLRVLSLGRIGKHARWSTKSVLDLSLEGGFNQLRTLTELVEFDFCQMPHKLGIDEFKFMLRFWPKLEVMHGSLHVDADREAFIESYLRNARPGIKLKRDLRYKRRVTQTDR
ncbi:hypothetical protein BGZ99_007759 [Dissophora globulifera]|uniref:RNI-like protein n=1 Tax=Dissophora globulifera TaxID=979702 RepID=A0A9P6R8Z2_9FUNG|nr:hypothetical protein BGZ99_007759 [Dissophora globulifera]